MTQDKMRPSDNMALAFLRDNGPHTMDNPLDTEEAVAAALVFLDLEKRGLVRRINFGNGNIQFSVTDSGLQRIASQ